MAGTNPTVRRKRLGIELKRCREASDATAQEAADLLECSVSKIYRLEGGHHGIRPYEVQRLLDLYGVTDGNTREALTELAKAGRKPGWWTQYSKLITDKYGAYIGFEGEASELWCYDALAINGLLQTEEYARALFRFSRESPDAVDRKVKLRMERQSRLWDMERPLDFRAVLDEGALRRTVGGPEVMREQLRHLVEMAERPNITVVVLPLSGGVHPGMVSSFTLLKFPEDLDPDIVYVEGLTGDVYEEGEAAERYRVVFDDLRTAALGPAESVELINKAAAGTA